MTIFYYSGLAKNLLPSLEKDKKIITHRLDNELRHSDPIAKKTLAFVYHNVSLDEPRNLWKLRHSDPIALDEIIRENNPEEDYE